MKLFSILIALLFITACTTPPVAKAPCDCERTYYVFHPSMMGPNGQPLTPGYYEKVGSEKGSFNCVTDQMYLYSAGANYTHYKTICK